MGSVIFEPAVIAWLLAGTMLPGPLGPGASAPVRPASACSRGTPSTAQFDCCLHIAAWDTPPTTQSNHPAQSQNRAADPKEGR